MMEANFEADADLVEATRDGLCAGDHSIDIRLGLTTRSAQIERGERDCLNLALPMIAQKLGPAATWIDAGFFAGPNIPFMLAALERPKAGVIMTAPHDRQRWRSGEPAASAPIQFITHDAADPDWPVATLGASPNLVSILSGAYGLLSREAGFDVLDHASAILGDGDFVLLCLDQPGDGAVIEALYGEFCHQIATTALSRLGQHKNLHFRLFYDAMSQVLCFGMLAGADAQIGWNGTICTLPMGSWLSMGAISFTDLKCGGDLHPDFAHEADWTSQDGFVSLVLLRKV